MAISDASRLADFATGVGTDGTLSANNINATGIVTAANVNVSAAVTANSFIGDGSQLTNVAGGDQNLQEVTDQGSVTTNSITANAFIGDGSQLTNLPGPGGTPTLQEVTTQGNTTSNSILINTKIELNADGTSNFNGVGTFFDDLQTTGKLTAVDYSLETLPELP